MPQYPLAQPSAPGPVWQSDCAAKKIAGRITSAGGSSDYKLGRSTATATCSEVVGRSKLGGVSGRTGECNTYTLFEEFGNYGRIGTRKNIKRIPIRIGSLGTSSIRRDTSGSRAADITTRVHRGETDDSHGDGPGSQTPFETVDISSVSLDTESTGELDSLLCEAPSVISSVEHKNKLGTHYDDID